MTVLDAGSEPSPLACPACGCDLGDPNCCTTYVNEVGALMVGGREVCPWCLEDPESLFCCGAEHPAANAARAEATAAPAVHMPAGGTPCT